jgi:hypothetical protein
MHALLIASALARPGADATWELLEDSTVRIECTEAAGEPWCRATALMSASASSVASSLENMGSQADVFEAVSSIRDLGGNTYHVTLDFPGMMSDRDYVVTFSKGSDGGDLVYSWVPVTHAEAPPVSGVVRLSKMAGEWRLSPDGENTRVTYLWQADLMGSFPSWALPVARKKTGNEALKDLANSRDAKLLKPSK